MQRGWDLCIRGKRENLKERRKEKKNNKYVYVLKGGGLTHVLTLTALGEENRTGYPRGPQRGRVTEEGGELPEAALRFEAGTRKG